MEKKKTEMALKSRKEIADYIAAGKPERAKIRVEHIIREDYYVEGWAHHIFSRILKQQISDFFFHEIIFVLIFSKAM